MITMDDPAMEHYNIAAEHLNAAHLAATSVAAPLEMAEIHLEAFKAAVNQNARNATEATSQSGESRVAIVCRVVHPIQ